MMQLDWLVFTSNYPLKIIIICIAILDVYLASDFNLVDGDALSDFERRLISLWTQSNDHKTASQIKRALAQEGDFTALQTIKNTINRWQEIGSILDFPQNGQAKMIPLSHYRFIDDAMAENDEHTAGDLKKLLVDKFGKDKVTYSARGQFQEYGMI